MIAGRDTIVCDHQLNNHNIRAITSYMTMKSTARISVKMKLALKIDYMKYQISIIS